jgi:hypothetical protein
MIPLPAPKEWTNELGWQGVNFLEDSEMEVKQFILDLSNRLARASVVLSRLAEKYGRVQITLDLSAGNLQLRARIAELEEQLEAGRYYGRAC